MLVGVLAALAVLAVTAVTLMLVVARRTAYRSTPVRPVLGSQAQLCLVRAERAHSALRDQVAGRPGFEPIVADAGDVLVEVRGSVERVAVLDRALAQVAVPALTRERDRLADAAARAAGQPTAADLAGAHHAVCERLAGVARQQAARDALLARLHAAVAVLERARDETFELLTTTGPQPAPVAGADLADRLLALRAGLGEVQRLSAAVLDPAVLDPAVGPAAADGARHRSGPG